MDRYMMISQDCHAGAPWFIYRKYLDPQYRDEYERWVTGVIGDASKLGQAELDKEKPAQFVTMTEDRQRDYLEAMEKSMGHLGNWDPDVRVRELDREGIAGEVIFCDGSQKNHPPFSYSFFPGQKASYELRRAGCKAHNRWLAEFCQSNKGRHAGIAMITMDDVDEAIREIRWARENGLFGGVLLPALPLAVDGPESFWHHPRYDPVWAVCEELQMPLNTHATNAGAHYGGSPLVGLVETAWTTFRPFWFLLWGGIFERHPKLKFCPTESGGMAVLWFNAYFDDYVAKYRRPEWVKKAISMKPSDYWHRQCYVGASAHSTRAEIDARYQIGVKNIMWGSDYPHPEGTWPASIERTQELFAGIPEDEVRMMVGGNAAEVYGFDVEKLGQIAAKIGPKVADLRGA
jgi:predicted TIM-barrel fold metal-dependent hydrolase